MPVGGFVTVRITAFVAAESDRRLTLLASQPITRLRLIGAEIAVTAVAATVLVTGAGLAWLGVIAIGVGWPWPTHCAAPETSCRSCCSASARRCSRSLDTPPDRAPRRHPTVGGLLLLVTAESIAAPDWVRDISPFAHLAPIPLAEAGLAPSAVMLAGATLLTVVGPAAYRRRDVLS